MCNKVCIFSFGFVHSQLFSITAAMCEYGSVYMPCGPACEQTCRNIGNDTEEFCESMHCVEGCFCPPGYVRDGECDMESLNLN